MGKVGQSTGPTPPLTTPVFSRFWPVIRRCEPGKIVLGWPRWVYLFACTGPVFLVLGLALLVGALVAGELSLAVLCGMVCSLGAFFVKYFKFVDGAPWVIFEASPPLMTTRWLCFRKRRRESLNDLTGVQVLLSGGFHQVSLTFAPQRFLTIAATVAVPIILANTKNRSKAMIVAQAIADCLGVALSEHEYRPIQDTAIEASPHGHPVPNPALVRLVTISALVVGLITGVAGAVWGDLWIRRLNLGIGERFAERAGAFVGFLGGAVLGVLFVFFLAFVVAVYWAVIKWVIAETRKLRSKP